MGGARGASACLMPGVFWSVSERRWVISRGVMTESRPDRTRAHHAMPRPIQATIHTDALRHNLARVRAATPDAKVWAVVKANAYGHGIERAWEGLRGADGFALLDLAEAERVRALGWRGPILLLEGVFEPRDLELCSRLNLWHAGHHEGQIDQL